MNIFAVELTPYDKVGATEVTLRYATQGFVTTSGDTPGDAFFDERLKQPALLKRDAWGSGRIGGRRRVGFGDMVLLNGDGALDGILDYAYDGRDITVYYGEYAGTFATDMVKVFVGTMEVLEHDLTTITIKIRDRQQVVNVAFQETLYAGDNALPAGLEGVSDLKGKPKPILYGKVLNISPPLVNSAKLIYQVNDGAIDSLQGVYDRGISLGRTPSGWTSETSGTANNLNAVGVGNSWWIAVGASGTIIRSNDNGASWAAASTPSFGTTEIYSVAYSASQDRWIAGAAAGKLAYSTDDGDTWTQITGGSNPFGGAEIIHGVVWGEDPAVWVAVGSLNIVASSSNGTAFTSRTNGFTGVVYGVSFVRNLFVGAGANGEIETSVDGTTWTGRNTTVSANHLAPAFGVGIMLSPQRAGAVVLTSDKGESWLNNDMLGDFACWAMAYGGPTGEFIAVGATSSFITAIVSSRDGVSWTVRLLSNAGTLKGVAVSDDAVISVGGGGVVLSMDAAGTYASEANLLDDTLQPEPGTYKVYLAGGLFRLGSVPTGIITADATQGAAASDRTAGQLYTDTLIQVGLTSADWNAGDITALDSDNNDVLGYWSGVQSVQGSSVLDQLASSPGAWWGVDRTGIFRIQRLEDPSGESSTISLDQTDIVRGTFLRRRESGPDGGVPVWRSVVRFAKNWTVQGSDVAAGVSDARRGLISKEWQEEEDSTAAVKTTHILAREQIDDSLLTVAADAAAEATRRLGLFDSSHASYEFDVALNSTNATIDLGTIIDLTFPRFGFASGSNVVVLSVDPDAERRTIRLGVWI